jgi:large subunit ribosomal protein L10
LNRAGKETFVSDFTKGINDAQAIALLSFNKLSVEQMTSFRLALRKNNVRVKVVKNTLAKRVFETTNYKDVSKDFQGPTLVAYSNGDPVTTAKAIWEWIGKENFDIKLKSGVALGQVMSEAQLKALSKLPGRNELYVSFLWALKSAPTKFLYALQDHPRKLGYALGALRDKKAKESGN